jgi:hypothetical protein
MPSNFMESSLAAIKRDGLALARIPYIVIPEMIAFGGQGDTQLIFVATHLPDMSTWKIFDCCCIEVCQLLSSRAYNPPSPSLSLTSTSGLSTNIFYDILLCLIKRFCRGWSEINVNLSSLLTNRILTIILSSN